MLDSSIPPNQEQPFVSPMIAVSHYPEHCATLKPMSLLDNWADDTSDSELPPPPPPPRSQTPPQTVEIVDSEVPLNVSEDTPAPAPVEVSSSRPEARKTEGASGGWITKIPRRAAVKTTSVTTTVVVLAPVENVREAWVAPPKRSFAPTADKPTSRTGPRIVQLSKGGARKVEFALDSRSVKIEKTDPKPESQIPQQRVHAATTRRPIRIPTRITCDKCASAPGTFDFSEKHSKAVGERLPPGHYCHDCIVEVSEKCSYADCERKRQICLPTAMYPFAPWCQPCRLAYVASRA